MKRALLLCAGRGRRFEGALGGLPKVLIEVAEGVTLLSRHLRIFEELGLDGVTVVVGFEQAQVQRALQTSLPVEVVENPRFSEGSLVSLACAADTLSTGTSIVMDADVLYPSWMMRRLLENPAADAVLYDAAFMDEEMKIALVGGRVRHLSKRLEPSDYEAVGRGPGFYKVSPRWGSLLVETLQAMDQQGLGNLEYEDAMNRTFDQVDVQPVSTQGAAWTEIDNEEDLARAREDIWPRL